jgi:NAD(P)-dependent dehydrogenase (short-subunit alcohol dehydrogenase family)
MLSQDLPDGALVTGGSKGIGYAIAAELARRGYRVGIAGRDLAAAEDAARRIEAATGNPAFAVQADIGDRRAAVAAVGTAIERCGRLRVLVNNVGGSVFGDILQVTDAQWDDAFDVKLFGAVATIRAALPHMIERGGGVIVNIAGTGGIQINSHHMAGGAANIALVHLTKCVAHQMGRNGIRAVAVSPGPTATERWNQAVAGMKSGEDADAFVRRTIADTPLGRVGQPEDIARAVGFLVSEDAGFITGEHLVVDGGRCRVL